MDPFNLTDEEKARIRKNSRKWRVQPGQPIITIFVRHWGDCKYTGDEFEKRCRCPKHLRWSHERKQYRYPPAPAMGRSREQEARDWRPASRAHSRSDAGGTKRTLQDVN